MITSNPVRVGVIGASPPGFGDRAHLPAVHAAPGLTVEAVCTTREETARAAARKWGARKWYAGVEGLCNDPDVDLVTVAVRPRMHHPLTMAALGAGKPVFCEWPLALNTTEAREMRSVAEQGNIPTAVGLQGRFAPAVAWTRRLVADGAVGRPLSFVASQMLSKFEVDRDRAWLVRHEEASGALFVAFGHVVDSVQYILGEVENISARQMTLSPAGVYTEGGTFEWQTADTVMAIAELSGGVVGTAYVSNTTSPPQGYSLRIIGEEGQILLGAPSYYQFSPVRVSRGPLQVSVGRGGSDDLEDLEIPKEYLSDMPITEGNAAHNVARALTDFAESIQEGRRFRPDFADGVNLHRLLDAAMTSNLEGRRAMP
ncbi:MAG: Gfo/Idh/MocA family oxidoreductase [bacterium]|nr:Gfo/Idh/MocA family oxidoreductase [Acidimicrobiia bacterium]MCY4649846.1 Gfo/Idh/MocA family oxidoreductase [bacterium]